MCTIRVQGGAQELLKRLYTTDFDPRRRIDFRRAASRRSTSRSGSPSWRRDSEERRDLDIVLFTNKLPLGPNGSEPGPDTFLGNYFDLTSRSHIDGDDFLRRDDVSRSGEQELVEGGTGGAGLCAREGGDLLFHIVPLDVFLDAYFDHPRILPPTGRPSQCYDGRGVEVEFCAEATYLIPASEGGERLGSRSSAEALRRDDVSRSGKQGAFREDADDTDRGGRRSADHSKPARIEGCPRSLDGSVGELLSHQDEESTSLRLCSPSSNPSRLIK
ncbi:hypothetical protein ARMGADRAFT_1033095 [Armillaria gallica]|uniref:Uncharacterized protein n=1 Tax=Armillaria gallica TaxID=47427 RepID=A0A2H3D2P6_ARMGA|nr:hypothetical protein ARMGADRAFT_1033095 [Armillaria gallica]